MGIRQSIACSQAAIGWSHLNFSWNVLQEGCLLPFCLRPTRPTWCLAGSTPAAAAVKAVCCKYACTSVVSDGLHCPLALYMRTGMSCCRSSSFACCSHGVAMVLFAPG